MKLRIKIAEKNNHEIIVLLLLVSQTFFLRKLTHQMKHTAYGFLRKFVLLTILPLLFSCTAFNRTSRNASLRLTLENNGIINQHFYGFVLYDPVTGKYLYNKNGSKYFTPASNTKVLTLAATIEELPDSIPTFLKVDYHDKEIFIPVGDPTFLHQDFPRQNALRKLKSNSGDTLFIGRTSQPEIYGPGWAWDDYLYYFQPERSDLPMYGNVVRTTLYGSKFEVQPDFFEGFVEIAGDQSYRARNYNLFSIPEDMPDSVSRDIPFQHSSELVELLLTDTLDQPVVVLPVGGEYDIRDTIYNTSTQEALRLMMTRSDNFLAEQLLIVGQKLRGFSSIEDYIRFVKEVRFPAMDQELIWVDGSGLSRYNMVAPESMISVLDLIWQQLSIEELKMLFPTGGVSGTLKDWYAGDPDPYLFAKTGTLRHNHNLSGFVETESGRTLLFSFMNNHYATSSTPVKKEMEKIMQFVRDNY